MITNLVPLARPRAGLTLRSKMIGIPTLRRRAEVVGGEAGRVDGVEIFGRKHVGLCLVSHPIGGGVDKLFSGKGLHRMRIEGIHVSVPGGEDGALPGGSALGWQGRRKSLIVASCPGNALEQPHPGVYACSTLCSCG